MIGVAEEVLAARGVQGLTLRECARRAGVSHAAPANHFGDVRGLLTAVAARGHERMAALMATARRKAGGDARTALLGVGQAYVLFALGHRAQFALMHRYELLNMQDAHLMQAAQRTFAHLQQALIAASPPGALLQPGFETRGILAWSAVHGFTQLVLEGALNAGQDELSMTQVKRLLTQMLGRLFPALTAP
jgi:AcrR family transcriptional regulator